MVAIKGEGIGSAADAAAGQETHLRRFDQLIAELNQSARGRQRKVAATDVNRSHGHGTAGLNHRVGIVNSNRGIRVLSEVAACLHQQSATCDIQIRIQSKATTSDPLQ